MSSGFGVALLFAYLAVRPTNPVSTADGGFLAPNRMSTQMKVESVAHGDLTAKMQAMNECDTSGKWRVLFGFYVSAALWKSPCEARGPSGLTRDWETCMREGLRLARKHGQGAVVHVSTAAKCTPVSPLLTTMQNMLARMKSASVNDGEADSAEGKYVVPTVEFWKLVNSRRSMKWVNQQLRRFLNVV